MKLQNYYYRIILFVVSISYSVIITSQNQNIAYPNVSVKTPKAAALDAYSDVPVSYYTGVPDITIPLYEIDVDGYKIPITLSYHASGIRVSQEATWVGLGWSLNTGGTISRQVNCTDDFLEKGWDRSHPWITHGFYDGPTFTTNTDPLYTLSGYPSPGAWAGVRYYLTSDPEPDVFTYNIPGYSGKFIFGTNKQAVLFDKNHNIKVEVIREGNSLSVSLKLTDGFGNQYFFNDKELSLNYLGNNALNRNIITSSTLYDDETSNYITWDYIEAFDNGDDDAMEPGPVAPYEMTSAWCLTRIVTNKGREIYFTYDNEEERLPTQETSEIFNTPQYGREQHFYRSKLINQSKRLKKIIWDVGCVEFTTSSRYDIKGTAKKLDRMIVKNSNGDILKDYNFSYSYFNDDYAGNSSYEHVFKRLKLTGLSESSFLSSQGYTFDYYPGSLPAKNSKNTDYWGLQNGRIYGEDYCVGLIVNNMVYPGVTKEANFNYAVIGTLKQINYPTGGYARFTYENHDYGGGIGVDVNNNLGSDMTNTGAPTSGTNFQLAVCNNYIVNEHPELPETDTLRFRITTASTLLSIAYNMENHNCSFKDPDFQYCSTPLLTLYRISDNGTKTVVDTKECPYLYERNVPGGISETGEGCEDSGNIGRTLSVGRYELLASRPPKDVSTEWNVCFNYLIKLLDANYDDLQSGTPVNPADNGGAGLRIAKIETNATTRRFIYPQGTMLKAPLFYYFAKRHGYPLAVAPALIQTSKSKTPLTTFNRGNLIGYDWVEERILAYNDTTRIRYYYMNEEENEQFDDGFPDSPYYINYTNGLLTKKETYKNQTLLKEENYTYTSTTSNRVYAYRDKSELRQSNYMFPYHYDVEWPLISSISETLHETGGNIVKSTSFTYNSWDLKSTESLTTNGTSTVWRTKYPTDFSDATSLAMTNKNVVSVPVEVTKTVGGSVYDGEKVTYDQYGSLYLPSVYWRLNTNTGLPSSQYSNAFAQERHFALYNDYGNPVEVYHNGDVTTYIWSYYGFYPIAEVKNATYSQVSSIMGASSLSNFCDRWPTDAEITTFLAPLRNAAISNGFLVISYTHKPLFGVTSLTGPSGMKSFFEYDTHGRLQKTKDTDQNVLQQFYYYYHY